MSAEKTPPPRLGGGLLRTWASAPLLRAERLTLLAIVGAGVTISLVLVILSTPDELASAVFQLVLTASFAVFVWSPLLAACVLLACMGASFAVGDEAAALLAVAVAVGAVVRTGTRPLLVIFVGGFLLSGAAAATYAAPGISLLNFAATLLVATVSGAVGYLLTVASAREQRLQRRLQEQERAEVEATLAERQRIADELHDVIAHDLTVIAMYSRVLDQPIDPDLREQSQRTIREAAQKALGDLRRVVEQAQDPAILAEPSRESLSDALENARAAVRGVGDALRVEGDPEDPRIPRVIDAALARIVRESITNVLKHGGRGSVDISITVRPDGVRMTVRSPMPAGTRRDEIPSGGYGVMRMTARARQLGGKLSASEVEDAWVVDVSFQLA